MFQRKFFFVFLTILLILGSLTASVSAQDPPPSEEGAPGSTSAEEIIGDDPDENGFSGEDTRPADPITPSESGGEQVIVNIDLSNAPDSRNYTGDPLILDQPITPSETDNGLPEGVFPSLDGEPDQIDAREPISGDDPGIRWSGFYYYNVAGSTFHTRASTSTWAYGGSGCIYRTNGTQPFVLFLDLPDGARIDYLRVNYYDAVSGTNGFAGITRYDGQGSLEDLTSVYSSGDSGYGTQLSGYINNVVDNFDWAYTVFWNPNINSDLMAMCSLRVAYRLP